MKVLPATTLGAVALAAAASRAPAAKPARAFDVASSVEVSTDAPLARHVESVLAINPRDPNNLLAAVIDFGENGGVVPYASRDGGKSWSRGRDAAGRPARFGELDPAVAFARDGAAYLLADGDSLMAVKSTDGGFAWGAETVVPGRAWDRPWIAGGVAGPSERLLYVTGKMPVTVFGYPAQDIVGFSISADGGARFPSPRLFLPAPDKELVNVVNDLVVLPDGRILLALQLFPPAALAETPLHGYYAMLPSLDLGKSFGPPRRGPSFRTFGHANEGKSLFGLAGSRAAVDASGGSRAGRLYLTWVDAIDGFYRVMAAATADAGLTWSPAVRLDEGAGATDASVPTVAVDGRGIVGVAWYDRRADPSDGCYQLFFASSSDGGATFSPEAAVDETPTCPLLGSKDAGDPVSSEYRFKNGGDTMGVVGLPGGGFQIAWIRQGKSEMQLWSTRIAVR
ncbi:MAG TPA: sialidase family protein [Thermoanaerobaculia bacterium]